MKRRDLEQGLRDLGWHFVRHGGSHDTWTNAKDIDPVPRHKEINEVLAIKILRNAKAKAPKEVKG